jgi:hypothetical protein
MPFFRQSRRRRLLTALLLVAYGPAVVLGYGLHALWDCEHCHDTAEVDHCHGDDCDHHATHVAEHFCHSHLRCETGKRLAPSEEECSICSFLAQAQSEHADETPELCTTISPAAPLASECSDLPPLARLHLARGPPLV